ncbi:POK9 protein, partial [Neopipo cinnamomea]|nr:POK9 protein [Neopipo cinnamomea]
QLRSTVSQFGATGEPTRQILDYIWSSHILLPSDYGTPAAVLQPATHGSLGLDLAAAITVTILTTEPHLIPTNVKGPLIIQGQAMGGLIIGRSSLSLSGLFVIPGLIDADYSGEFKIMAYTLFPPVRIEKSQRIAQLIPLPQMTQSLLPMSTTSRGEKGFGSTGDNVLLTVDLSSRPKQKISLQWGIEKCMLTALLDTGADSSIVSPQNWP